MIYNKAKNLRAKNYINIQALINASLNGQEHVEGATDVLEDGKVFYLLNISGTDITIKDKNDVVVRTFQAQMDFSHPLEIANGFKISGTTPGATFVRI